MSSLHSAYRYLLWVRYHPIHIQLVTRLRTGNNQYIFSDTSFPDTSAIYSNTAIQRDTSYLMYHHPSGINRGDTANAT